MLLFLDLHLFTQMLSFALFVVSMCRTKMEVCRSSGELMPKDTLFFLMTPRLCRKVAPNLMVLSLKVPTFTPHVMTLFKMNRGIAR